LHQNFPELQGKVTGGNYPPPPLIELFMKVFSWIQICGIVVAVLGSKVFSLLGFRQVPSWYYSVEKNGIQIAILVYLLLPQVMSAWLVTGAFEIIMDGDKTVFSKIAMGRLPSFADLSGPLVEAGLKMVTQQ
jgi:selT/selW/selH-like putative selenoprotein